MNIHALLRIFTPGGIISHDQLTHVINLSKKFNIRSVQFGLRQDINLLVERHQIDDLKLFLNVLEFDYEFNTDWSRNIVTSYVANGIFPSESWLTEGTYLDILDTFDYKPSMRVNIVDPNQGLVPLFTGHFNFIASKTNNYWHLYLDVPKWFNDVTAWPMLIYSDDISKVAQHLENIHNMSNIVDFAYENSSPELTLTRLAEKINELVPGNNRRVEQALKIPFAPLPYYEGMNKLGNKYWLGIYKRSYQFPIDFLEAISEICYKDNINKLCITPWRSILIKDIKESAWLKWIKLLGKYSINIRHSSLELNWRLPDFDKSAIEIKQYLVNEFDRKDIRTYGLTFAIRTPKVDLDAIIVIEKLPTRSNFMTKQYMGNFNIYFAKNFEINQKDYVLFAKNITYSSLPQKLQELTSIYYEIQNAPNEEEKLKATPVEKEKELIYRCIHCLTTYNQEYGDETNKIAPGTPFANLPDSFRCPVCDAPKKDFDLLK